MADGYGVGMSCNLHLRGYKMTECQVQQCGQEKDEWLRIGHVIQSVYILVSREQLREIAHTIDSYLQDRELAESGIDPETKENLPPTTENVVAAEPGSLTVNVVNKP